MLEDNPNLKMHWISPVILVDIRKFLVWEAPQSIQLEIRNNYDKALSLEKESKQLLEKAKQQVEDLIEQAAGGT
ncbi:MAG: hypothetical protein HOK24_23835 [Desulfobacula sp.]|jgi:F0F1-type ATP synthase membrane subunit b/b'|uniref:hypothetical protein n=1 Tax=Desulfobacula sp. TaxID=2593537 RepID=UPI001D672B99|nr:hypothetical protein [Desulfobacula sp.]MBT4876093.1 hypothetical protein [Desulfobacula sp.]MBT5547472.1 hypothetical protein [Desulfobacula sp.]